MLTKFNIDSISLLQEYIFKHTGKQIIVRDYALLDSSINSVFQTFDGKELYSTIEEKGARLGFNIITNHPFFDGNKRVGMLAMLCFLEINNVNLKYSNQELITIGLSLASGKTSSKQLVNWVNRHKKTNAAIKEDLPIK